jgi:hypothetical protein
VSRLVDFDTVVEVIRDCEWMRWGKCVSLEDGPPFLVHDSCEALVDEIRRECGVVEGQ